MRFPDRIHKLKQETLHLYCSFINTYGQDFGLNAELEQQRIEALEKLLDPNKNMLSTTIWDQLNASEQLLSLHQFLLDLSTLENNAVKTVAELPGGTMLCGFGWSVPRLYLTKHKTGQGDHIAQVELILGEWEEEFSAVSITANGDSIYPFITLTGMYIYPPDQDSVTLGGYYQHFLTGYKYDLESVTYPLK